VPSLKFWLYMDTESGSSYDQLTISVVKNGVVTQIWSKATAGVGMLAWKEYTVSLAGYAGSTVQLQLFFNTVDSIANSGLGVLIDDLRVTNACP
jgi:hypothetical protein